MNENTAKDRCFLCIIAVFGEKYKNRIPGAIVRGSRFLWKRGRDGAWSKRERERRQTKYWAMTTNVIPILGLEGHAAVERNVFREGGVSARVARREDARVVYMGTIWGVQGGGAGGRGCCQTNGERIDKKKIRKIRFSDQEKKRIDGYNNDGSPDRKNRHAGTRTHKQQTRRRENPLRKNGNGMLSLTRVSGTRIPRVFTFKVFNFKLLFL